MKKIIITITVFFLVFITVPTSEVFAQEIDDETAYAVGSLVVASQGGTVDKNPNTIQRINTFGRDLLQNAVSNGSRITDIVVKNGRELLFNPSKIFSIVGDTYRDFNNFHLSWASDNRLYISINQGLYDDSLFPNQPYNARVGFLDDYVTFSQQKRDFQYWELRVTNLLHDETLRLFANNNILQTIYDKTNKNNYNGTSLYFNYTPPTQSHDLTINRFSQFVDNSNIVYVQSLIGYKTPQIRTESKIIPDLATPTNKIIEQRYSSTFKDNIDPETGEIINNNFYSYNLDEIMNQTTEITNNYITNNYTTVINEGDTIIHEPDGEGGGSFWGALLRLLETVISTIGNLGSSIANAIGKLFEPLIGLVTDIFDWLTWFDTDYMSESFNTIQTDLTSKFPDFSNIVDTNQSISSDVPDLSVNIGFMGLGQQKILDVTMYSQYMPYLKTVISAFLYLMTLVMIYVKITGGGMND